MATNLSSPSTIKDRSSPEGPPCAIGIFGRGASAGKAKTRLIPLLGARGAAEFQAALISDALLKGSALAGRISRYFFLAGREFRAIVSRTSYTLVRQRGAGLGGRLERAFRHLLRRHAKAVVIGTDSPLLWPALLREAFDELRVCDAVLGPCPDGGYYLIGLRRLSGGITAKLFRGIRWGSAFAFRDTLRSFLRMDLSCAILGMLADVDRPEDVWRLKRELARSRRARRLAPAAWSFLKGFRAAR